MKYFTIGLFATFVVSISPAIADRAQDFKGMKNGGSVLIGLAEDVNAKIDRVKGDVNNPNRGEELNRLREMFRYLQNNFASLRVRYTTRPPCTGKTLEEDLGQKFPPMHISG